MATENGNGREMPSSAEELLARKKTSGLKATYSENVEVIKRLSNDNWIELLVPGAEVFIETRDRLEIGTVSKIMEKTIDISARNTMYRFKKADGSCKVDAWSYMFLRGSTEKTKHTYKMQQMRGNIGQMAFEIYSRFPVHKLPEGYLPGIEFRMLELLDLLNEAKSKVPK